MSTTLLLGHATGICIGLGCVFVYKTENSETKNIQKIQAILLLLLFLGLEGLAIYGVITGEFPGRYGGEPVKLERYPTFFNVTLTFLSVMAGWFFIFCLSHFKRLIGRR